MGHRNSPRIEWDSDEFGVLELDGRAAAAPCAEKERFVTGAPPWFPGLLRELAVERAEFAGLTVGVSA